MAAPVVVALLVVALVTWVRADALGEQPRSLTAHEAVGRSRSQGTVWVHLSDARFECPNDRDRSIPRSVAVRAPSLGVDVVTADVRAGIACPPTASVVGLLKPERGEVFVLSAYSGPGNERALAATAFGFAIAAAFLGSLGYILRRERAKVAKLIARAALPRDVVLAALAQPPLKLRRGVRAAVVTSYIVLATLALFGLAVLGNGLVMVSGEVEIRGGAAAALSRHGDPIAASFLVIGLAVGTAFWLQHREAPRLMARLHPKIEWWDVLLRSEVRTNGVLIAHAYRLRSASGRVHEVSVPHLHPPMLDDDGRALVVVANHGPEGSPTVVSTDGYPFVMPGPG